MQFFKMSYELITDKNITSNEFRVYTYLMSLYNAQKDYSYPSINTIAEAIHISVRTVKSCIAKLERIGYIAIEKKKGLKGNYNTYKKFKHLLKDHVKKKKETKKETVEDKLVTDTGATKEEVNNAVKYAKEKGADNIFAYAKYIIKNKINTCKNVVSSSGFSNFTGRGYSKDDYDSLERKLLGWE